MKYFSAAVLLVSIFRIETNAQFTRYIIRLKDKSGTPYTLSNPIAYLSQRAIDRRTRHGILTDSTDLPINPSYISQIGNVPNVTLLNISKWLNAITIQTSDANAITTINGFSFVQSTSGIASRMGNPVPVDINDKQNIESSFTLLNSNSRT